MKTHNVSQLEVSVIHFKTLANLVPRGGSVYLSIQIIRPTDVNKQIPFGYLYNIIYSICWIY